MNLCLLKISFSHDIRGATQIRGRRLAVSRGERLLAADIAKTLFAEVLAQARSRDLPSTEHFTVDGTLIEAWASHKSFKRKNGSD
jgi:transposase